MATEAELMITKLKSIADVSIDKAAQQTAGIIQATASSPVPTKPGDVVYNVTPLPAMPALPALPADLKVDYAAISALVTADITKLQASWISKFLPTTTDVSVLDNLVKDCLGGTSASTAAASLASLAADTKAALSATIAAALASLNTGLTNLKANVLANLTSARAGVAGGLAIAGDGTQNIAWANARDEVAREAARKERETISKYASRGFSLPNGVLLKQIARDQQDTLGAASQIAADQAVKTQQLFFDVSMKSVDTYMRALELQGQQELQTYTAEATMRLRFSELEKDVNQFTAKQAFDHLGLQIDFTKFTAGLGVQYRLGVINGMNGLVTAYATLVRNEADYMATIANAQRAAQQAIVDYYRAAIQFSEITLRAGIANQSKETQYIEVFARAIAESVGHNIDAAWKSADVYTRTASAALSGLNGIASVANQIAS